MKRFLRFTLLASSFLVLSKPERSLAVNYVNSSLSSAADIFAGLEIDVIAGTLGPDTDIGLVLTRANGVAPMPYNSSGILQDPDGSVTGGAFSLNLESGVDSLSAVSSVDAGTGSRSTTAAAALASAGASLQTALLELLSISVTEGTEVLRSNSAVDFNGTSLLASASSNFVDSNATVTISLLGNNIPITAMLSSNTDAQINVSLDTRSLGTGALITGAIILTPDAVDITNTGNFAVATITSLEIALNLSLGLYNEGELVTGLGVTGDVAINRTIAQASLAVLPSGAPVPEGGSSLLFLGAGLGALTAARRGLKKRQQLV